MGAKGYVKRRTGLRPLFALVTGVAALSTVLVALVAAVAPPLPDMYVGAMRVASVSYTPEDPRAGEMILVTAEVHGSIGAPLTVVMQYASYFGTVQAGGHQMTPIGHRAYQTNLPAIFPDGTEVWIVVAASAPGTNPVLSDSITFDVGTVVRGGPSNLRIGDVTHSPVEPLGFQSVTVEATVTSASPIVEVDAAYMSFCRAQARTIDPPMYTIAPTRYTITISPQDLCGTERGTLLVYRVLAVDASGNTAVSDPTTVRFG